MDYIEFCSEIKKAIEMNISNDYHVTVFEINNLNGIVHQSLCIHKTEDEYSPHIYVQA